MKRPSHLSWLEMNWVRPFEFQTVCDSVVHLSGLTGREPFVWEVRIRSSHIRYLLGFTKSDEGKLRKLFSAHNPIHFEDFSSHNRSQANLASHISIHQSYFSLKLDAIESMTRSFLALSSQLGKQEEIILQVVIGKNKAPSPIPKNLPNPTSTWFQRLTSNIPPLSPDSAKLMKEKLHYATFQTAIRLGIISKEKSRQIDLHNQAMGALRIMESSGAKFRFKNIPTREIDEAEIPWHFPTHTSSMELASLFLLPSGEASYAQFPTHPRTILPPIAYKIPEKIHLRTFGQTLESKPRPLHISILSALSHTQLIAPTGGGKSVVMTNLALKDIEAGRSVLVIDGKQDTITQILERIPEQRREDVVVIDPTSFQPVGLNIFELVKHGISPDLVSDLLLSIFEKLFPDHFGIRSRDILLASFSTLAKTPEAHLGMVPVLLTNKTFRQKIIKGIYDPLGLESFWNSYEQLSDAERQQLIAPSLNKLRQLLNRPQVRAMLTQAQPKFSLMDLFLSRKIVLINLNKGMIGAETARLLGYLITASLHALTLKRASIPPEKRHPVMIYIDEFPNYLSVAEDFEDSLAMARSLGVAYILAHQSLSQLPPTLKQAIEANCRTKIVFGLEMTDAREIAKQTTELTAEDIHALPPYQVYVRLGVAPNLYKWISGITYPLAHPLRDASALFLESTLQYGISSKEVEERFIRQVQPQQTTDEAVRGHFGRRKREKGGNQDESKTD